jgi:hypothetical protein
MFIPDLDLDFLPLKDPRSRGQKGGSWIRIHKTAFFTPGSTSGIRDGKKLDLDPR